LEVEGSSRIAALGHFTPLVIEWAKSFGKSRETKLNLITFYLIWCVRGENLLELKDRVSAPWASQFWRLELNMPVWFKHPPPPRRAWPGSPISLVLFHFFACRIAKENFSLNPAREGGVKHNQELPTKRKGECGRAGFIRSGSFLEFFYLASFYFRQTISPFLYLLLKGEKKERKKKSRSLWLLARFTSGDPWV
jgi:hypothetical protein